MEWFEIIHIRLFSQRERQPAMNAFFQLGFPNLKGAVKSVKLLQDVLLETDLRIVIQWRGKISEKAKSVLGVQLAAAFAEFGKIHHIVCKECAIANRSK
jgi:hypothetical protein